jgi:hypothetical protein
LPSKSLCIQYSKILKGKKTLMKDSNFYEILFVSRRTVGILIARWLIHIGAGVP